MTLCGASMSTRPAVVVALLPDMVLIAWCGSKCTIIRQNAISREKELKKWRLDWKIRLIEENNPEWRDLYPALLE
jgi:predicted GIY-YIG superfamily endonuclease